MVGVSLSGFTLSEFLGGAPGDKTFADPHILTVSILTTAIVLVLSLLGKGLLKSFSFLIALVVGTVVAAAFGMVDFSPVASKGWLGLPTFLPYGPFTFDWKIFIPFFIAYMVAVMELSASIRRLLRFRARPSNASRCATVLPARRPVQPFPR